MLGRFASGDIIHEESLVILPMKLTTKGEDILRVIMDFATEKNCHGKNLFLCALMERLVWWGNAKLFYLLNYHCGLIKRHSVLSHVVVSLVIRVVNFSVARALNENQFKEMLEETGSNYSSLMLHSNFHLLSKGKVLTCFSACLMR